MSLKIQAVVYFSCAGVDRQSDKRQVQHNHLGRVKKQLPN